MRDDGAILKGRDLTREYLRGKSDVVHALSHVDITLKPGEFIMVFGPSGSGKSTLLNVLSGLDKPTEGKVVFDESVDIVEWDEEQLAQFRQNNVGFVFQAWELIPALTAIENVELPLYPSKISGKELRTRAIGLLKQVGLFDRMNHFPDELSGGEQQRVAIARALISRPKILFADEPTGNLDEDSAAQILRLLKRESRRGTTVLLVSHNEALKTHADTVLTMRNGQIL